MARVRRAGHARLGMGLWLGLLALSTGCADTRTRSPQAGSESHFLAFCSDDDDCDGGLACIAEVCTQSCDGDGACRALAAGARCVPDPTGADGRMCDLACTKESDCSSLDPTLACVQGACRHPGGAIQVNDDIEVPDEDPSVGVVGTLPEPTQDEPDAEVSDALGPQADSEPATTLEGPATMAFEVGFGVEEDIVLRDAAGHTSVVNTWPPTRSQRACLDKSPESDGRFRQLVFDAEGTHLLLVEIGGCRDDPGKALIAHDLRTGQSRVLDTYNGGVSLFGDARHTLVVAYDDRDLNGLRIDEWRDGALQPVALPEDATTTSRSNRGAIVSGASESVLLFAGMALSEQDGVWQSAPSLDAFEVFGPQSFRLSASRGRVCGVGSLSDGPTPIGILRNPDGTWETRRLSADAQLGSNVYCAFDAQERFVAFGNHIYALTPDGLGERVHVLTGFALGGAYEDTFYGVQDGVVVGFRPETAQKSVLVSREDLDFLCGDLPTNPDAIATIHGSADGRHPLALVERYCECVNCYTTGTLSLRLSDGSSSPIVIATSEHAFYTPILQDNGGALLLFAEKDGPAPGPGPGEYLHVTADNQARLETLAGVDKLIHGVTLPH